MSYDPRHGKAVNVETYNGIMQITMVRPDLMNRLDVQLMEELTEAFLSLGERRDVRAVVLAAEGNVFSAGGDFEQLRAINSDSLLRERQTRRFQVIIDTLLGLEQPIIAAAQGAMVGAGANIAFGCDLVVASRNVVISDPHVRVGLVAGEGGCAWWPQSIGLHRARRYLLTGDSLDAETAFSYGLVTDLVDTPEQVIPAARELAAKIAALPPLAVQGTKRSLNHLSSLRAAEVLPLSMTLERETVATDDLLEAISAFKERRPGVYHGV